MLRALKTLYGTATPAEALSSANVDLDTLELGGFLASLVANTAGAGIEAVRLSAPKNPVHVHADAVGLEDAISHVLSNAAEHRTPGTDIEVLFAKVGSDAVIRVHNSGQPIPEDMLESIFGYGVSLHKDKVSGQDRGQGLFVAKTNTVKMGGSIAARNELDGVTVELRLVCTSAPAQQG